MADNTRTTQRSIVPCMIIVDGPAFAADDRASLLAQEVNTVYRDREDAGEPRTKLYLCEGSPTTELTIDEALGGDPRTLAGLTCDNARGPVAEALAALRAISAELRTRKINHGTATSPTLTAFANRIDAALDNLGANA